MEYECCTDTYRDNKIIHTMFWLFASWKGIKYKFFLLKVEEQGE